jgi:hypothetical protein
MNCQGSPNSLYYNELKKQAPFPSPGSVKKSYGISTKTANCVKLNTGRTRIPQVHRETLFYPGKNTAAYEQGGP